MAAVLGPEAVGLSAGPQDVLAQASQIIQNLVTGPGGGTENVNAVPGEIFGTRVVTASGSNPGLGCYEMLILFSFFSLHNTYLGHQTIIMFLVIYPFLLNCHSPSFYSSNTDQHVSSSPNNAMPTRKKMPPH